MSGEDEEVRPSTRRRSRRKEGRQGQITPTSSSMPDQRHTWTMSSVFLVLGLGLIEGGGGKGRGSVLVGLTVWVNSLMVLRRVRLTITTLEKGRGVVVSGKEGDAKREMEG